jgi:hypothetical protein
MRLRAEAAVAAAASFTTQCDASLFAGAPETQAPGGMFFTQPAARWD